MCVHHWAIETPNGTTHVLGVCKLCKETRQFLAAFVDDGPKKMHLTPRGQPTQVLAVHVGKRLKDSLRSH